MPKHAKSKSGKRGTVKVMPRPKKGSAAAKAALARKGGKVPFKAGAPSTAGEPDPKPPQQQAVAAPADAPKPRVHERKGHPAEE